MTFGLVEMVPYLTSRQSIPALQWILSWWLGVVLAQSAFLFSTRFIVAVSAIAGAFQSTFKLSGFTLSAAEVEATFLASARVSLEAAFHKTRVDLLSAFEHTFIVCLTTGFILRQGES